MSGYCPPWNRGSFTWLFRPTLDPDQYAHPAARLAWVRRVFAAKAMLVGHAMTLQRFSSWLISRIAGTILFWAIAVSVAAGYVCAPQLEAGSSSHADSRSATSPPAAAVACAEHPPDTQGSLSKPLADESAEPVGDGPIGNGFFGSAAYGAFGFDCLPMSRDRLVAEAQPVYLATSRLRL